MGFGLGSESVANGDYDITTADKKILEKYKIIILYDNNMII